LQIDNFATAQEGRDWLSTPAFAENPIGVEYDPDSSWRASAPACPWRVGHPGSGAGGLMLIRLSPGSPIAPGR
jgi:hypothetical protein